MTVEVLVGPPGCGKSTIMRREAVEISGRYLFAYPTEKLLREQAAEFGRELPLSAIVLEAHAKSPGHGTVQKKLAMAAEQVTASRSKHAIVLITHASLMAADLTAFAGWHFRIDEAPAAVHSGLEKSELVQSYLRESFDLGAVGTEGWHVLKRKAANTKSTWRAGDGLTSSQAELLNNMQRPNGVFVKADRLDRPFEWVSVWSPHVLDGLANSVVVAGASYMSSIGSLVAKRYVDFRPRHIPMVRTARPSISVYYFTQGHEGSTVLWGRSEGRKFVVQLCDYLVKNVPELGFWSANEPVAHLLEHRLSGVQLSPKAAGQNTYRAMASCAFIYSAGPTPNDVPLRELFGITDEEIRIARQDEDIMQFVMRGAIRNPDYAGQYDIYLYSRAQAERLRDQLNAAQLGAVSVLPADAGFMTAVRSSVAVQQPITAKSKTGRTVKFSSVRRAERRHRQAMKAGRTPGLPGRPRKG